MERQILFILSEVFILLNPTIHEKNNNEFNGKKMTA